jgi:hypothetical protein
MAKVKVPKRIGGVKVPKKLRKQAKRAIEMVDTPAARDLAIAGLAMAAETFIDRRQSNKTAKSAATEAVKQARGGRKALHQAVKNGLDGLELGEVLRAAAAEGARRFLEGFEEGRREAEAAAGPKVQPKRNKASGRSAAAAAG